MTPSVDHFGCGPFGEGQHRCAARHRLDHHHAERLVPPDGEQEGRRPGQELELAFVGDLAEVDGVGSEQGLDLLGEVLASPTLADLGGHEDPDAGPRATGWPGEHPLSSAIRPRNST